MPGDTLQLCLAAFPQTMSSQVAASQSSNAIAASLTITAPKYPHYQKFVGMDAVPLRASDLNACTIIGPYVYLDRTLAALGMHTLASAARL